MATASERGETRRYLLDRPQRLGILPTWWFWNDRNNWRLVRWGFAALASTTILVLSFVSLGWIAEGLIAGGTILVAEGILEKYIRRQATRRRALAESTHGSREPASICSRSASSRPKFL